MGNQENVLTVASVFSFESLVGTVNQAHRDPVHVSEISDS